MKHYLTAAAIMIGSTCAAHAISDEGWFCPPGTELYQGQCWAPTQPEQPRGDADLGGANLRGAYLRDAYLGGADLRGADLRGADLNGVCGLNDWIKCIQVEDWPISYTSEVMQIGCQRHPFDAWRNFSDAEIRAMDGMRALTFWHKWREVIFKIIEMTPAQPTKAAEPVETEAAE